MGQLINTIGVPVLLIGTFKANSILTREVRQIRRGTGQGDMIWKPMREDKVWRHFVESLWKYQYTRNACPLTAELCHALYVETQGITDFAVKVYMLAQIRAITSETEIINVDIIESVAQDSLQTAAPVLKALRDNDARVLARYEDIPKIDFEEIIKREINQESRRFTKFCVSGDNHLFCLERRPDYATDSSRTTRRTAQRLPEAGRPAR